MASSSGRLVRLSRHKVMDLAIFATCSFAFSLLLSLRACLISWLCVSRSDHRIQMPGINYAQESSNRPRLVEAVFPIADPVEHFKLDITRSSRRHHLSSLSHLRFRRCLRISNETKSARNRRDLGSRGRVLVLVMRHDADPNAGMKMPVPVFVECRRVTH